MRLDDLLTRLLLPIARLAMARGLGVRDLADPLKRAFLIIAQTENADRITDSRLALRTGLQRRDVVRLRDTVPVARAAPAPARLLSRWPNGQAILPRSGPAPSFEALARETLQDVHPRTLLDLLIDAGALAEEGEEVRLLRREYLPVGGSSQQLGYLADNLYDHGMAAVANVTGTPQFFDRAAHYDGLTAEQITVLRSLFEARQMQVLREVAEAAEGLNGGGPLRLRFGGYAHWEETK